MPLGIYEVVLGIDRAGHDTGERISMQCLAHDRFSAAMVCEASADAKLDDPETMYTHAMRVHSVPVRIPAQAATPLPMAV